MHVKHKVSVVIPTLNEQDNVGPMAEKLEGILKPYDYEVIFVDGDSQDSTIVNLKALNQHNSRINFLTMSRNFGHQMALKAGLDHAQGDCVVFLDCDLQHPPELIIEMLGLWQKGYEVVYTLKEESKHVPLVNRLTAALFYRTIKFLSDFPIKEGAADFLLVDRSVANVLKDWNETPFFLRGIIAWVGFKQTAIRFKPEPRFSGRTKYSLRRLVEFAIDGITAFSIKPLRLSIICGSIVSGGAFIYFLYALYVRLFTLEVTAGWASLIACVLLIGGIQLIMLGIMGEYLGKLFIASKGRPNYIIRQWSGKKL